ncbi:MAG: SusC/RagA family TonB-linked outer membrane protein [Dysgonamonadaceae bacterium]|jgi:TonB-linked SusC/RagA family outer membrane protein|nr:SusC/RagA family TonB-linked outer membrane protein [Dysgonamonadaceae bacterium]
MKKIAIFLFILLMPSFLFAQNFKVDGSVYDETGEGIQGALVSVKGDAAKATITGEDGSFSLVVGKNAVLTVSFLGYQKAEIPAGDGKNPLVIQLKQDFKTLSEVVVTGYQELSRERATGAFESVRPEFLDNPTNNIGSSLIGTVSGVQVTTDINGDMKFEIRGLSTLGGDNKPLIVVDGFPIQGDIRSINPNDVVNITVLKDAAAASIWGTRAANGVIAITTRGGTLTPQKTEIEFSTYLKTSPKIDLDYARSLASSASTIEYEKMAFNAWSASMPNDAFNSMASFSPGLVALQENLFGYISDAQLDALLSQYAKQDNSKQIKKYLLQGAATQQYNLNINSSNGRVSNNLSLLYEKNAYYQKGHDDWKAIATYRTNTSITKWLEFNFLGSFTYKESTSNYSAEDILSLAPYEMLIDEDGNLTNISKGIYWPNLQRYFQYENFPYEFTYNPITELGEGVKDLTTTNINARFQGGLKFKLLEGLTFDSKIQYELNNTLTRNLYSDKSYTARYGVNTASSYNRETGAVTLNLPLGGFLDQSRSRIDFYDFRNQINFDRTFGDRHAVTLLAGTDLSERIAQTFNHPRAYGYNDERMTTSAFPNGPGSSSLTALRINNWLGSSQTFTYINSFSYGTQRYFSYYGNGSYTLDGKYTLSGSVRSDATNLITDDPKYRYKPFWSVGGSWNLSKEAFLQSATAIDRLVARLTYGFNGNVDTSTSFRPLLSMGTAANAYTNGMTATVSSFGNPTLRWEKTATWNLGFDYSFLKGKFFGKIDYYNKNSTDLIATISIPAINGTTSQKLNNAAVRNHGIEVELGMNQNIAKGISWRGNLNMSYNINKVTSLFKAAYEGYELTMYAPVFVEGHNANAIWSYVYNGIKNVGTEASPNWQPTVKGVGDSYFTFGAWTTGNGTEFCVDGGTTNAPLVVGFTNSFRVRDFDLQFIVTGKFGHVFRRESFNYPPVWGARVLPNSKLDEVLNGDPMKIVPLPMNGPIEGRYYFWDRFHQYLDYLVEDAGHIRFQEINLTYNLPTRICKTVGLKNLQLFVQGNNLGNIYFNQYNEDPEFPRGSMKLTPQYTFGLKVKI